LHLDELFGKLEPSELKHFEEDKYEERSSNNIHLDLLKMHLRVVLSLKLLYGRDEPRNRVKYQPRTQVS